ncbi:immunoglobulin mu Fc receptor isoform X1 [Oryctolagus cuniculus]|uniref:immunoglobulin mu Fc receptor isoform X1 n=1 Tax=Oryctolagus cuniculus TaxID=9986 RepID=UPI00222FDA8A|nr:fas apoptotic inhibitory molecule 3 isoform X4 [Oryctolagus cuniculus]
MDFRLWLLCFLPVAGALKPLPEVQLEAELGGSVTIKCPLPEVEGRMYLCRQMAESRACATVVSNHYTKDEYKSRVTLTQRSEKHQFLVKMTELTERDSGIYACGVGINTDRGKTKKVALNVHSAEYEPFWEEEPTTKPPKWLYRLPHLQMPHGFRMPVPGSSFRLTPKVTTPAQSTEAPAAHRPSPTTAPARQPRVSRAFSGAAARPPTLPPSASKFSAQGGPLRPWTASYSRHTRLHRQRALSHEPPSGTGDQGLHILIPSGLAFLLLALLGLVVRRALERRKAFSRRVRRLAVRMRARDAARRPRAQRSRTSPRPRSQNVYSACPRRAQGPDAAGAPDALLEEPAASGPPTPPQVPETPWLQAATLQTSCEYVTICHQPAAKMEDPDSDDYVNIPYLTHLPSCAPGPGAWC